MDIGTAQAAISGLKSVSDLAKSLLELNSIAEVKSRVIDLQNLILNAQSSALALQADLVAAADENRKLSAQIATMRNWEVERERYKLISPEVGVFVYALRASMSNGQPPHWICTHCYERGVKGILGPVYHISPRGCGLLCPACRSELQSKFGIPNEPGYAGD